MLIAKHIVLWHCIMFLQLHISFTNIHHITYTQELSETANRFDFITSNYFTEKVERMK